MAHGTSHTILYIPNATQVAKMLIKKIRAKTGNFGTANGCPTRSMGDKGENSTKGIGLKQTTRRNLV